MPTVRAPGAWSRGKLPVVFLAGTIDQGVAANWQSVLARMFERSALVLNPRRKHWDQTLPQDAETLREQVTWELDGLESADLVLFHFEPGSLSPVSLLELGLFHSKALVHCPEGYWRKGNVDLVCERYGVEQARSFRELLARAYERLDLATTRCRQCDAVTAGGTICATCVNLNSL